VKSVKKFIVTVNGKSYEVEVEEAQGSTKVDNLLTREPVKVATIHDVVKRVQPVKAEQKSQKTEQLASQQTKVEGNGLAVTAPMPGTVLEVKVNNEDMVSKGQVLIVLEAMKMENEIVAPKDGKIGVIKALKGSTVKAGDVLLTII